MYNVKKRIILIRGGGLLSGPYCEYILSPMVVEGGFANYTGSVTNGNRVYMKQFDRSAHYHVWIMIEGTESNFNGTYENLQVVSAPRATRDVFTNMYFRIVDFTKNAFVKG